MIPSSYVPLLTCSVLTAVPSDDQKVPVSPYGTTPEPFTFDFTSVKPTQYPGGTVKVADSRNFKVAKKIAVAEVTVEPGAMRELHVSLTPANVLVAAYSDIDRVLL